MTIYDFTMKDNKGNVAERFESKVTPAEISTAVEKIL